MHERPAIVGWSEVVGPLAEAEFVWQPKQGADQSSLAPRPHWVMPLAGLHLLDEPITIDYLRDQETAVLDVRAQVEAVAKGTTYFPFNGYGSEPGKLRAQEAYMTKFPTELAQLLGSKLELGEFGSTLAPSEDALISTGSAGNAQGYMTDTARKLAVERHAVDLAIELYESLGATDIKEIGKPYDLSLLLDGEPVRVEVKGSTTAASSVIVTRNEVKNANEFLRTELVVVDSVVCHFGRSGELTTQGGNVRRWVNWKPSEASLAARTFDHVLPPDATSWDG